MNMSTPTLVRLKRRITDDPTDILVLSAAKRSRSSASDDTGSNTAEPVRLLKLAGTVDKDADDAIEKIVQKKRVPNFEELKKEYRKVASKNSTSKRALDKERERGNERYRVVNAKRSLQEKEENLGCKGEAETEINSLYQLFDVVDDKGKHNEVTEPAGERLSCNGVEMIREYRSKPACTEDQDFVYDVYYAEGDVTGDFNDSLLDGLVSIQPFCFGDTQFMYDEYRDDPTEFKYDDDEDSNDEDHRGNEYPDEDEFSDDDGYGDYSDHLDLALDTLRITSASRFKEELSSDEEDELVYTSSFNQDVNKHGRAYAKYKQNILREFQDDGLLDDTNSDGSSDDD